MDTYAIVSIACFALAILSCGLYIPASTHQIATGLLVTFLLAGTVLLVLTFVLPSQVNCCNTTSGSCSAKAVCVTGETQVDDCSKDCPKTPPGPMPQVSCCDKTDPSRFKCTTSSDPCVSANQQVTDCTLCKAPATQVSCCDKTNPSNFQCITSSNQCVSPSEQVTDCTLCKAPATQVSCCDKTNPSNFQCITSSNQCVLPYKQVTDCKTGCKQQPEPTPTKTTVKMGLSLAKDSNGSGQTVKLSEVLPQVDVFWDWQPSYNISNTYDIKTEDARVTSKFLPMLWGPNGAEKVKFTDGVTPAVLLWNEPDMTGTMMSSGDASGTGYWGADPFPYGNALAGGISSLADAQKLTSQNSSFDSIAGSLLNSINIFNASKTRIATPAMAVGAFIEDGCTGMPISLDNNNKCNRDWNRIPSDPTQALKFYTPVLCGPGTCCGGNNNGSPCVPDTSGNCKAGCTFGDKRDSCVCNGWLQLAKGITQNAQQPWWDKCQIINIHCYNRFAHLVKLHILEYVSQYYQEISSKKKEIWLTECAHVPSVNDKKVVIDDAERNARFLVQLLWLPTSSAPVACSNKRVGATSTLPGLFTTDTFSFTDHTGTSRTGNWILFGLGAFTWFSSMGLGGFATCMDSADPPAPTSSSSIWNSDGKLNVIWDVLTGKRKA